MIDWSDAEPEPPPIELLHAEAACISLSVQIREWSDALDIMRWRLAQAEKKRDSIAAGVAKG